VVIPPNKRDDIKERWLPRGGFKTPTNEQAISVLGAFMQGATTNGAANYAGVAVTTMRTWRQKDSRFDLACAEAAEYANRAVVFALFNAATLPDLNGKINVSACIFWLKNRAKDEWADLMQPLPISDDDVAKIPVTDERLTAVSQILQNAGVLPGVPNTETVH
jgi:hypothetical protein